MKIQTYFIRRLAYSLLVLFGLSILIFFIARVLPGNPLRMALGARVPQWVLENLKKELNLDKPIYMQYIIWLKNALHGNLGISLLSRRPVLDDIKLFLPATLEIMFLAVIIETVGGLLLGALSALHIGKWPDNLLRLVAYLGVVTPSFIWAVIFMLIFGFMWPILPVLGRLSPHLTPPQIVTGFMTIDSLISGNINLFWDALKHLIMPATALAFGGMAQATRVTRSSMLETLNLDYIWAEIASGIPTRLIISKYAFKPSLISPVSIIGLDVAAMIGNAFLVELVFNYPGISRYGVNAILSKDLNAVVAVIMVIGVTFVFVNMFIDLIIATIDPRVRIQMGGKA